MKNYTLLDKAFLLKRTPLFASLELDLLVSIADKLGKVIFAPSECLFAVGDTATRLYLLVEGKVAIYNKDGVLITHLTPVDLFGEEALFTDGLRRYRAESEREVLTFVLAPSQVMTIMAECPSVATALIRLFAEQTPFRPRFREAL